MLAFYGKPEDGYLHSYVAALSEFSVPHIEGAIKTFTTDEEREMPMPLELRDAALARWSTATVMLYRARILLGQQEPQHFELPAFADERNGSPLKMAS
jgi:hypothetical protein